VTERWRAKLEELDREGPSDDVFRRAKAEPVLPEEPPPRARTRIRVATGVAAFVVFALAISLFAIPALRPGRAGTGGQGSSASDGSTGWTTYTDPLGWTLEVPAQWTTLSFTGAPEVPGYAHGASFFSGLPSVTPGGPFSASAANGDVMVRISHDDRDASIADDSSFPLSMDDFHPDPGPGNSGTIAMRGDGLAFSIEIVYTAKADIASLSPLVDHMIASIAFQPWSPSETRNGWTVVDGVQPAITAEWVSLNGKEWLANAAGREVFGPGPTCAGGLTDHEVAETGVAFIVCSDGTGGQWNSDGEPIAGSYQGFADPLPGHPAVLSWDGKLLVKLGTFG
jgi:hypothetical protein